MNTDIPLFVFSLFNSGALLFLCVYVIVTLSDLECDHLNAKQCCSKLNPWVLPELLSVSVLALLLLLTGHWYFFIFNLPPLIWMIKKYKSVPVGNIGVFDPTQIHNYGNLKAAFKDTLIKLAFYLISFCIYLYCMIIALLTKA